MADLSARTPVRALSLDEIERMLADHRLYLETEYHQATARISHQPIWPGEISRALICVGSRWTAPCDAAVLIGTDLRKANLRGAGFRHAKLDAADLREARLGGAFLVGTSLRGADLRGAYLRLARLDGAVLSDANLDGAEGLTRAQLDRAHCNSGATLPVGLTGVEDGKR
jgi:Pentapeptide repeats (8 copies)